MTERRVRRERARKRLAYQRAYRAAHFPAQQAYAAAWRDKHREWLRDYVATRRARQKGAFVERVYRRIVFKRDKGLCGICRKRVDPISNWHLDHIQPLSRGGAHCYANVQVAHPRCNVRKGAKWR